MERSKEGKIKIEKTRLNDLVGQVKDEILGKRYELSFAFVSKNKIKELNKKYRGKNEPTDILSFPLEKNLPDGKAGCGEILICKEIAKKKSKEFFLKMPELRGDFQNYLIFLVIHGSLHLKGLNHGVKMREYELSHYSRYRRRHL
jgi:probable rRNA maturation factor